MSLEVRHRCLGGLLWKFRPVLPGLPLLFGSSSFCEVFLWYNGAEMGKIKAVDCTSPSRHPGVILARYRQSMQALSIQSSS